MPPATATRPLDLLSDALLETRGLVLRPGYRARLLGALGAQLSVGAIRVLRAVQRADGDPCVADVAERLLVDPSTASRMVDQQVEAGYLRRDRHPEDRRRARLSLTAAGSELLDRATVARRELLAEATRDWDDADVALLGELLDRLCDSFDRFEAPA